MPYKEYKDRPDTIRKKARIRKCRSLFKFDGKKIINQKEVVKYCLDKYDVNRETAYRYFKKAFELYLYELEEERVNKKYKKLKESRLLENIINESLSCPLPEFQILGTEEDETIGEYYRKNKNN